MVNDYLEFKKLLKELKDNNKRPTLLLHSCCGPCSSYVIDYLIQYFDITIYYYNPNIYPKEEYYKRLDYQKKVIEHFNKSSIFSVKLITDEEDYDVYLDAVGNTSHLGEGSKRCYNCYDFRIKRLSEVASINHFDYFSTVMSVSPYKNSIWINELGNKYSNDSKFLYSNFKKEEGYKKSIKMSYELELYRQDWCGCSFSKEEHYKKVNSK